MKSWEKFTLILVTWCLLFLSSTLAFAETKPRTRNFPSSGKTFSGSYAVSRINPVSAPPLAASASSVPEKRVLNLRFHPTHIATMILDSNTVVSLRGDLDFVIGDKVTLGPAVVYHQTSLYDAQSRVRNEALLEAGILSNVYLTGNTSQGGFIFRPHLFYIEPNGERSEESGNFTPFTSRQSGVRGGAELIFHHILANGFNFEVGGGLSYYFRPYSLEYTAGSGVSATEAGSRLMPTVSIGVGWAF